MSQDGTNPLIAELQNNRAFKKAAEAGKQAQQVRERANTQIQAGPTTPQSGVVPTAGSQPILKAPPKKPDIQSQLNEAHNILKDNHGKNWDRLTLEAKGKKLPDLLNAYNTISNIANKGEESETKTKAQKAAEDQKLPVKNKIDEVIQNIQAEGTPLDTNLMKNVSRFLTQSGQQLEQQNQIFLDAQLAVSAATKPQKLTTEKYTAAAASVTPISSPAEAALHHAARLSEKKAESESPPPSPEQAARDLASQKLEPARLASEQATNLVSHAMDDPAQDLYARVNKPKKTLATSQSAKEHTLPPLPERRYKKSSLDFQDRPDVKEDSHYSEISEILNTHSEAKNPKPHPFTEQAAGLASRLSHEEQKLLHNISQDFHDPTQRLDKQEHHLQPEQQFQQPSYLKQLLDKDINEIVMDMKRNMSKEDRKKLQSEIIDLSTDLKENNAIEILKHSIPKEYIEKMEEIGQKLKEPKNKNPSSVLEKVRRGLNNGVHTFVFALKKLSGKIDSPLLVKAKNEMIILIEQAKEKQKGREATEQQVNHSQGMTQL